MNSVELQGQVSRIYHGTRNSIVTLYIRGRRSNLPQVVFTGKNKELIDNIEKGDFIRVSGLLKTRGERQEGGKILHTQFIRGESATILEDVEEGSEPYMNEAELVGEIVRAYASENMISLLVRPDGEKFNVWAFKYTPNAEEEVKDYEVGKCISAQCEFQTARKEIRDEVKFFENLVIKDANVRDMEKSADDAEAEE